MRLLTKSVNWLCGYKIEGLWSTLSGHTVSQCILTRFITHRAMRRAYNSKAIILEVIDKIWTIKPIFSTKIVNCNTNYDNEFKI